MTVTRAEQWMNAVPPGWSFYMTYWHEPGPLFHLWMRRSKIRQETHRRYRARKARR